MVKKQVLLLLCLLVSVVVSKASDYQIISNQQIVPVINMLEYDLCNLEKELSLIRYEQNKYAPETICALNRFAGYFGIAWLLVLCDRFLAKSWLSDSVSVPMLIFLPLVSIVFFHPQVKIDAKEREMQKINHTIQIIKEQIKAFREGSGS